MILMLIILTGIVVMLLIIVISLVFPLIILLILIILILVMCVVLLREIIVLIDQILSYVINHWVEGSLHINIIQWVCELYAATGVVFILHHLTFHYLIFSIKTLLSVLKISYLFTQLFNCIFAFIQVIFQLINYIGLIIIIVLFSKSLLIWFFFLHFVICWVSAIAFSKCSFCHFWLELGETFTNGEEENCYE